MGEWFLTDKEVYVLWLALDHAIGDCFLPDELVEIASKLHTEMESSNEP